MVKVKICGITNAADALAAYKYGADFLGFVFVKGTPREVTKDIVLKEIISNMQDKEYLPGFVGLFKDEKIQTVAEVVHYCGLNYAQLHGSESPAYCEELKKFLSDQYKRGGVKIIKAFKVKSKILSNNSYEISDYMNVDYFVFDTFHPEVSGGTGIGFDLEILKKEDDRIKKPFFIAGGLNPENVASAVQAVCPYGVDVSSGIEKIAGKKDENLLKEFIYNAKNV